MNKSVLIIDDDDVLRGSLARRLGAEGFDVITAESAEHAGEILRRLDVDAIILDRMMGGMNGMAFLQKLRARGDATPVIMLTAMSGPENAIDGLSGGANDYLAKPFQLKELVLRLNNIIERGEKSAGLPDGLSLVDGEFFVGKEILLMSAAEKDLLKRLVAPVGNIVAAVPMVAKRLRAKLNAALPRLDLITIRGRGYKLTAGI